MSELGVNLWLVISIGKYRAVESLAGARGKFFLGAPVSKNFPEKKFF
jgi:hypothetical protein